MVGSAAGKGAYAPTLGPQDSGDSPIDFVSPERPDVSGALMSVCLVATTGASTLHHVTKEDLAFACMFSSIGQGLKKRTKSPLHVLPPVVDEEWLDIDEEAEGVALEEGHTMDSTYGESEPEEILGLIVSQAQRMLVHSLREMVWADFKLLPAKLASVKYSSLRLLHPPQSSQFFTLHPLLEKMFYA